MNFDLENLPKVSKLLIEGDEYYLKQNVDKKILKKRILFFIQKIVSKVLSFHILSPTANIKNYSEHEAMKLTALKDSGLSVPEVFFSCPEFFILEDCGERLKDFLKKKEVTNKIAYLKKAINSIANLHNLGFAHGGSQIRNFTIKNDTVYMIDFEEVIPKQHIDHIQVRDLLIFLISVNTLNIQNINYDELLKEYDKNSSKKEPMSHEIKKLISKVKFLSKLHEIGISKYLGKDIYNFSRLVHLLTHN